MSAYSPVNPISSSTLTNSLLGNSSTTGAASGFSSLLSGMMNPAMMGSGMSGMSGFGASGMDSMSMLAPLLITLIEKLIELELDDNKSASTASATGTAASRVPTGAVPAFSSATGASSVSGEIAAGFGNYTPKGRPVGGVITQYPHAGHMAYDFGIATGTQVRSSMDGKVVYAGWNNEGYGNLVIVENGPFRTYYAHLSSIPVSVGQEVKGGQVVGLSGSTGNSTGPHLHYEVRKNMVQQDPTPYLG